MVKMKLHQPDDRLLELLQHLLPAEGPAVWEREGCWRWEWEGGVGEGGRGGWQGRGGLLVEGGAAAAEVSKV